MSAATMYYAVFDAKPESIPLEAWKPWIHCEGDPEITRKLVLHRFLRNRGGIGDLRTVYLYEHPADAPCFRNGSPKVVTAIEYSVQPN